MATNISSRYKDIISKSDQIHSGPPAVHQLRPKKAKIGAVTRVTVGEKDVNVTNKTILVVGETGAGKSTLINALLNYSVGVKFKDEVWFQIVDEDKSQTSDVIVYEIFGFEGKTLPYSLTIIDTPGYGSTKGIGNDDIICERLQDLFGSEDRVHEVHAVGLVMKASDNQVSDRLMYVFDSVTSLFGKNLEKNLIALITHSDGMPPTTILEDLGGANIQFAKKDGQPVYFSFNNQQNTKRTEQNYFGLDMAWRVTQRGMEQFTAFLRETTSQKASEALKECIRLSACIQNLQERIRFTEVKQREMKQTQEALKKQEGGITGSDAEVYKEKEALRGGKCLEAALSCTVCEENCHYPGCRVDLTHCEVFRDGRCTSCTRKCPPSDHVKEKWRYVTRIRKIKNETGSGNKLSPLENLGKQIKQLTAEKKQLLEESYQHVGKLEEITLNLPAHSVSTYVHLDFLIEQMKEEGDTEKVQKLEEMRSREDEGTRAALQHTLSLISSRYEDVITNSFLIRSGSPAVYQLRPKKQEFGTLTRMTVGEKNPNKINKTILVVGETGSGKSVLINALINYSMGVKFEDEVWFQIVDEEKKSQSSDVIVYEIFGYEDQTLPYSLTIIDTPGCGNTRGLNHDVDIIQRLFDLFQSQDGVYEVHVVGLVIKALSHQVRDRLEYVFNSLISLFGKGLEKNTVALITHSDGRRPKNLLQSLGAANIKCAKNEENQPVYFLFDNCQHEERAEEEEDFLQQNYQRSEKGMRMFTDFLKETACLRPKATPEELKEGIRLTACIRNLQDRIKFTEVKEREMKQNQEALKKQDNMQNEEVTPFVAEVYKHKELIRDEMCGPGFKRALSCNVCEENCHYPGCTMALTHCEVFIDGRCVSCTGKCPESGHVEEKWRYVTRIRKIKTNEKNQTESGNKTNLLENLEKQIKELRAEKKQLLNESYQHVVRLEQIALKADSVSTFVHLDFLIEKMKEEGDTEKVQKLEEMRSRMDNAKEALLYKNHLFSSPYEDIMVNSFLIRPGPPAVYQLRPKKETIGTLTRKTVGEKNPNKTNKTILFVGETGSGKSALINALINYSMGVKFKDEVWFQIVEEKRRSQTEGQTTGQTESQTSDVIVYEIFGFEDKALPYSLTIIDTPGYGDTRGIEHDDIISERLLDLFRSDDGVNELHAVCLVMKASDNRLSDRLKYSFDAVMSLFGKNMEKNIVALITHSDGVQPENALKALETAKIKCARNEKNQPVHFLFNNNQHKDRTDENKMIKNSWDFTQKNMDHLTVFLGKSKPQKLMKTVEVLNERIRLKACIQNLQERIEFIELKQKEITQIREALKKQEALQKQQEQKIQEALKRQGAQKKQELEKIQETLKKHEEEMKKNENFTVEVDEPYKDKESIDGGMWGLLFYAAAVCCTVCEENCHYPGCTVAWKPEHCEVMRRGRCTVCTKKCPVSTHVKEKWRYVTKTRRVQKTNEEMKKKYETNKLESQLKKTEMESLKEGINDLTAADSLLNKPEMQQNYEKNKKESEKKKSLLENLEEEMKQLTAEKSQWLDESYQHVIRLQQIALNVDSVSTVAHLDFLIEKMKEEGDTENVQKLEEMRSRVDEGSRAAVGYVWNKLTTYGKRS